VKYNESFSSACVDLVATRNRRSVWTVPSEAYSEAHFATFPRALIEPCIIAGSRPGDVVFDPFLGSGTTAQVAQALGRKFLGIELNPDYASMQSDRTAQTGMVL
jgi:site-specific DNA-methyltransferase (cytosine-N4-specific)